MANKSATTFGIVDVDRRKPHIDILEELKALGTVLYFEPNDSKTLLTSISTIDVLIIRLLKIDEVVLSKAHKLKAIIKAGVGTDHIDVKTASDLGIHVVISTGNHISVAESSILLMLALSRNLMKLHKNTTGSFQELGMEAFSKVLGIVGYGRIGRVVRQIAHGLGMKVIVYDPLIEETREPNVDFVPLDHLLKNSDYITLHCPLNKGTVHMIGAKELSLMKKTAILINTARGPIVDERALYKCLKSKRIAGAGLDTFEKEPLSNDNPLLSLDNVIATPHRLCQTSESLANQMNSILDSARKIFKGVIPRESVNATNILKEKDRILNMHMTDR